MPEQTKKTASKRKNTSKHGRFNSYVLRAVDQMYQSYRARGYDINSYFTHTLDYGQSTKVIRANHPPKTMCVAAVCEVIIEALNLYYTDTSDQSPFKALPASSWNGGKPTDIRPYMFMYEDSGSSGTASALSKFSIGEEIPFQELLPGDFINFDGAV